MIESKAKHIENHWDVTCKLYGDAEEIAVEYAALTEKIASQYPQILKQSELILMGKEIMK